MELSSAPLLAIFCIVGIGVPISYYMAIKDGTAKEIDLLCRIDTEVEIEYVENGGVLHYVLRNLAAA